MRKWQVNKNIRELAKAQAMKIFRDLLEAHGETCLGGTGLSRRVSKWTAITPTEGWIIIKELERCGFLSAPEIRDNPIPEDKSTVGHRLGIDKRQAKIKFHKKGENYDILSILVV